MRGLWLIPIFIGLLCAASLVFNSAKADGDCATHFKEIVLVNDNGERCSLRCNDNGHLAVKAVDAESVTVSKHGGTVAILSNPGCAGIWVNRKDSDKYVAIYNMDSQGPVVGLGDPSRGGYPYAIGIDENNESFIQNLKHPCSKVRHESEEEF